MNEATRVLFLKVLDQPTDELELHKICTKLHFLDTHFPPDKLPYALAWLIDNKLVGRRLLEFIQTECRAADDKESLLSFQLRLLNEIKKEDSRRLIAGRDFV